ncbi:LbetaH domain-containing protein [Advenella incenata]
MDRLSKHWSEVFGDKGEAIPSIYYLWKMAQPYVKNKEIITSKKYENLIYLLHNSVVYPECKLGLNVKFAYGGIGVVVHKDAIIGDNVAIGQNVTIGGSPGKVRVDANGTRFFAPSIEEGVYIAAGARVLGGLVVGKYSVIGANAVVTTDVAPFSIYAGQPATKVGQITPDNCLKYKSFWTHLKDLNSKQLRDLFSKMIRESDNGTRV